MRTATLENEPVTTDAPVEAPVSAPAPAADEVKLTVAEQDALVAQTQTETGKPAVVDANRSSGETRAWSAPEPTRVSID